MSSKWLPRELALALALTSFLVAAYFGFLAIGLATTSSWPDQSTPIAMTPETSGSWEPRWEPTTRRDRARPLGLRYYGRDADTLFRELDLAVRIEPLDALDAPSRMRVGADGWIQHVPSDPVILSLAEPALVRRIDWKLGRLDPPIAGEFTLLVPGNPESTFPEDWPFFAFPAVLALAVACVFTRWAGKSGSRARRATFDVI